MKPVAFLIPLCLVALPAVAAAPAQRLTPVGAKGPTVVMLDMASRKTVAGQVQANGLLVFPPPAPDAVGADGAPAPDHDRIALRFDCKARTIALYRLTMLSADNVVIKADLPVLDPQPPADPTDARMLALVCGEAFPDESKIFTSEVIAIDAVRTPAPSSAP
jgi:hypothetical protein